MPQLDLVVSLCQKLINPVLADATLTGKINPLTAAELTLLYELESIGCYVFPTNFDEQQALGQPFIVKEVLIPRLPQLFFASDWDELLAHHQFRIKPPANYFILSANFYSKDPANNAQVAYYLQIIELIRLLEDIADISQIYGNHLTLFFMVNEKFALPIDYSTCDLCELKELVALRQEFIVADAHSEQRKSTFKSALIEMLKTTATEQRFKQLLTVFSEFTQRARDNYQLYVTGFSFEKVREEVQANRLEYTLKLNKVIAEIQNQLLAVPAALLLVGSQMDAQGKGSLKNWAIWLGALVFAGFLAMLIRNQRHSLQAIHEEIVELKQKLAAEHAAMAVKFLPMYEMLDKRYHQQRYALILVDMAIGGVLLFCTYLFGQYGKLW